MDEIEIFIPRMCWLRFLHLVLRFGKTQSEGGEGAREPICFTHRRSSERYRGRPLGELGNPEAVH